MSSRHVHGSKMTPSEFSSWTDFFRHQMTIGMIALLGIVLAQSYFSVGGTDAQFLVYTFGLLTFAVGAQMLVFWARIDRGFGVSGLTFLLCPWLIFLLAEAFLFSETPWRARYGFCMSLLPVMAFFTALHASHNRRDRWWIISVTAVLTLLSGLTDFLSGETNTDELELAAAASLGDAVRTVFGAFGHRAAIGAALLLVFFPMASLAASSRFKLSTRLFGGYLAVLFLFGIVFTRHAGVYLGFFAGTVLAAFLSVRKISYRIALIVVVAVCAVLATRSTDFDIGVFETVPVPAQIETAFSDDERAAGTRCLLPHAAIKMFESAPILGVGSGRFADEFEKYRTPQWQTDPQTCGNLFLHVLAENGIVGFILLFGPLAALFVAAVRACRKMPWQVDTESAALRRKMGILDLGALPEERVVLAAMLSGLLGVAVVFSVDYPRPIPGVTIACAIFGGIAAFIVSESFRRRIVYRGIRRHALLPAAFLGPILAFFLFLPTFRSQAEFQQGAALLKPFYVNADTGTPAAETPDYNSLALAETHLRAALRKNPTHGDAWNALAKKFIFDCRADPLNTQKYGIFIKKTAAHALENSEAVPEFFRTRAVSELILGDFDAMKADIDKTLELAPFNVPFLLTSAEMLRSFPQGQAAASALLEKIVVLAPKSHYAETMRAVSGLSGATPQNEENADAARSADADSFAVPEF